MSNIKPRKEKLEILSHYMHLKSGTIYEGKFKRANRLFDKAIRMKVLNMKIAKCRQCDGLNLRGSTESAPGFGSLNSKIMLVGQSLCTSCQFTQVPFTRGCGYLIDAALILSRLSRYRVFITNAVHCLSENNLIYTTTGLKKVKEVKIGDQLYNGNSFLPVDFVNKIGKLPAYKIETTRGYSTVLTGEHRVPTSVGLLPVNLLKPGMEIVIPNDFFITVPVTEVEQYLAEFAGIFDAEGCISQLKGYKDRKVMELTIGIRESEFLERILFLTHKIWGIKVTTIYKQPKMGCIRIRFPRNIINDFELRHTKQKPLFQNRLLVLKYLKGLFEGDAAFGKHITLGTNNYAFALIIRFLMQGIGFTPTLSCLRTHYKKGSKLCNSYRLTTGEIEKWKEYVGCTDRRLQQLDMRKTRGIYKTKITKITAIGKQLVYDIGVKEDDYIISDGILVHNCHPPRNRASTPDEKKNCFPYLQMEVKIIKPKLIVAMGNEAKASVKKLVTKAKIFESKHPASFQYSNPEARRDWIIRLSNEMDKFK